MKQYKCIDNTSYEHQLVMNKVYKGQVVPGIFAGRPFLRVFDDQLNQIAVAHLLRFQEVKL